VQIITIGSSGSDAQRRRRLFAGEIIVLPPSPASERLVGSVRALAHDILGSADGPTDFERLPPMQLFAAISALKSRVAQDPVVTAQLAELLVETGVDRTSTFLHRLMLRVVPTVATAASAAYHAPLHRDLWLAAPQGQVNWWLAVSDVTSESCLAFYPSRWGVPVANDSDGFDYLAYRARLGARREQAAAGSELREAFSPPRATERIGEDEAVRLVCPAGAILLFSAAHLHASVPNTSSLPRLSLDFRTVASEDLRKNSGAPDVDTYCSGSSLVDFRRADDGSPVPREFIPHV
jgi:hypothetical protein